MRVNEGARVGPTENASSASNSLLRDRDGERKLERERGREIRASRAPRSKASTRQLFSFSLAARPRDPDPDPAHGSHQAVIFSALRRSSCCCFFISSEHAFFGPKHALSCSCCIPVDIRKGLSFLLLLASLSSPTYLRIR